MAWKYAAFSLGKSELAIKKICRKSWQKKYEFLLGAGTNVSEHDHTLEDYSWTWSPTIVVWGTDLSSDHEQRNWSNSTPKIQYINSLSIALLMGCHYSFSLCLRLYLVWACFARTGMNEKTENVHPKQQEIRVRPSIMRNIFWGEEYDIFLVLLLKSQQKSNKNNNNNSKEVVQILIFASGKQSRRLGRVAASCCQEEWTNHVS